MLLEEFIISLQKSQNSFASELDWTPNSQVDRFRLSQRSSLLILSTDQARLFLNSKPGGEYEKESDRKNHEGEARPGQLPREMLSCDESLI
jgi:hypothetical protein